MSVDVGLATKETALRASVSDVLFFPMFTFFYVR